MVVRQGPRAGGISLGVWAWFALIGVLLETFAVSGGTAVEAPVPAADVGPGADADSDVAEADADDGADDLPDGAGPGDSGGGAVPTLDFSRLQGSLKSGGVAGLNSMLKAFQEMSAKSGQSDASLHIKKDADGNEMYDFRNIDVTTAPPSEGAATTAVVPQVPVSSTIADGDAQPRAAAVVGKPRHRGPARKTAHAETELPVRPAAVAVAEHAPETELPLRPAAVAVTEHAPEAQPIAAVRATAIATRKPDSPPPAPQAEKPVDLLLPEATVPPHQDELIAATPVKTASSAQHLASEGQAASGGTVAVLTNGLMMVRQSVDALLAAARSGSTSVPSAGSVVVATAASGEVVQRVQALETENQDMRQMISKQAEELKAVEATQKSDQDLRQVVSDQGQELKSLQATQKSELEELQQIERENFALRTQLRKASRAQAAVSEVSAADTADYAYGHMKTFFHPKVPAE